MFVVTFTCFQYWHSYLVTLCLRGRSSNVKEAFWKVCSYNGIRLGEEYVLLVKTLVYIFIFTFIYVNSHESQKTEVSLLNKINTIRKWIAKYLKLTSPKKQYKILLITINIWHNNDNIWHHLRSTGSMNENVWFTAWPYVSNLVFIVKSILVLNNGES